MELPARGCHRRGHCTGTVTVVLSLFTHDDLALYQRDGLEALQNARLVRFIEEAYFQGAHFPLATLSLFTNRVAKANRQRLLPLWEAGVRLPRPVGQAVSIVGALVIGEAAVSASLVSPAMVIVVAMTGISSFATPSYAMAITLRLLRFIMLILAGTIGFYGIMLGLLVILVHLNTLRSFGVPYLAPVAPANFGDFKDVFVRVPRWAMNSRPGQIGYRDPIRQGAGLQPTPPASSNPPPQRGDS